MPTKAKDEFDQAAAAAIATDKGEDWGQRLWSFNVGDGSQVVDVHADTEAEARSGVAAVLRDRV